MSSVPAVPMDVDFATWLIPTDLMNDAARRLQRWAGVQAIIAEMDTTLLESLIRVATRSKPKASVDSVNRLRKLFSPADADNPLSPNEEEFANLGAAVLAAMLKQNSRQATLAALSICTTSLNGNRTFAIPVDLSALAEQMLRRVSSAQRHRRKLPAVPTKSSLSFTSKTKKALEASSWEAAGVAFSAVETAVQASLGETLRVSAEIGAYIEGVVAVQDEELQMLWWLIGERSFDLDRPFKELAGKMRPLLLAKELADATTLIPGPVSLPSLLCKAGLGDEPELLISEAINSCPPDWLDRSVDGLAPSPMLHPIHFAMLRQRETGQGEAWVPGWAATVGTPVDVRLRPLALALQFYRERLLLR